MKYKIPNILTIIRIILVPFFVFFYIKRKLLVALILFCVATIADLLDSFIAKKLNIMTKFNRFMDHLATKILIYSGLCLFVSSKNIPVWWLLIFIFNEFVVYGMRMVNTNYHEVRSSAIFLKARTAVQNFSTVLMLICKWGYTKYPVLRIVFKVSYYMLAFSVLLFVLTGINYVIRNKGVFDYDGE